MNFGISNSDVSRTALLLLAIISVGNASGRKKKILDRLGGDIQIRGKLSKHEHRYRYLGKYWDYEKMVHVVIDVYNVSRGDRIELTGAGVVNSSSCFYLTQYVDAVQRLYTTACSMDKETVGRTGCRAIRNVAKLWINVSTAASSVRKKLFRIRYSLRECNAYNAGNAVTSLISSTTKSESQTGSTPVTPREFSTYTTSYGEKKTDLIVNHRFLLPSAERERTTVDNVTPVVHCPDCDLKSLLLAAGLSVAGVILIIIMIVLIRCCKRKRVGKQSVSWSQREISVMSIGSRTSETYFAESGGPDSSQLPGRYIFSPPLQRHACETTPKFTTFSSDEDFSNAAAASSRRYENWPDRVPQKFSESNIYVDSKQGLGEDQALAYVVAPVPSVSSDHKAAGFSGSLALLLNSRPLGDYMPPMTPVSIEDEDDDSRYNMERGELHPDLHQMSDNDYFVVNDTQNRHADEEFCSLAMSSDKVVSMTKENSGRQKDHTYVNVLQRIDENSETQPWDAYEEMGGCGNLSARKDKRSSYVSMAEIRNQMNMAGITRK